MKKFWPFPLIRNNPTSAALDRIFLAFALAADLRIVRVEPHRIVVTCHLGELRFWSANAYYAWASEGHYFARGATEKEFWANEMPSRYAVRKMRKSLDALRFKAPGSKGMAA